jgi:hypothetical protein
MSLQLARAVSQLLMVQQKEVTMFSSSTLLRVFLIVICILAVALGFTFWSWSFTTSRLNSAQSNGVYPSPAEGMLTLVESGYMGIQEVRITLAEPETFPLGGGPHVWFVIACVWAESREDGSPVGSPTHDFDFPGSYFLDTKEGWVLIPESSSPLFVGFWMKVFDLAGDDSGGQIIHEPPSKPACVRKAG